MRTWTTTHYELDDEAFLTLTAQDNNSVWLSLPGYASDGRGLTVAFTRAHLPILRQLVGALEAQPLLPSERDTLGEPFADETVCLGCNEVKPDGMACEVCANAQEEEIL